MPQRSQRHMTTGHGLLALFFGSVAIPPLFLFEVEQSAGGGNWEMIATGRHRGEWRKQGIWGRAVPVCYLRLASGCGAV